MTDDTHPPGSPVVVGVDGSDHSLVAADLAADEAARRRLPLEIVHAYLPPALAATGTITPALPTAATAPDLDDAAYRGHAEQLLHAAAWRVRDAHPGLAIVTRLRDGQAAGVLADAARQATLVVIGHRGTGGFTGLLAGSVGIQLASHATCPVIVVRERAATDAPVVVGVDGSEGSRRAAEFAAEAADRYEVPLLAVYAWAADAGWPPALAQAGHPPPGVPDRVTETLSALTATFPRLRIHPEVRQHIAAHEALVAASKNARLVVVGSRGLGGFRGLLLGSVSQALIHHAHCPVAVIGPATADTIPSI